ncbi:MAG: cytochrome c3 family protein [Planctomycetota bacterium]
MAQIFHPGMNILAKATIFGAIFIIAGIAVAGAAFVRSPYVTQVNVVREQPVPFSHQHHVRELGLDCRYCHYGVEKSSSAGIPSTEICMGCHSQVWKDAEMLRPVRESFQNGTPLKWTRVHDLPDFVYFSHKIHVAKGVGCESCHGRVDEMPLMRRAASLHMDWCVECHRHPERAVRPKQDLFQFGVNRTTVAGVSMEPPLRAATATNFDLLDQSVADLSAPSKPGNAEELGRELVARYGIVTRQLTDCVVCHR